MMRFGRGCVVMGAIVMSVSSIDKVHAAHSWTTPIQSIVPKQQQQQPNRRHTQRFIISTRGGGGGISSSSSANSSKRKKKKKKKKQTKTTPKTKRRRRQQQQHNNDNDNDNDNNNNNNDSATTLVANVLESSMLPPSSSSSDDASSSSSRPIPTVQCVLLKRRIPLQPIIRMGSALVLALGMHSCWVTAGIPLHRTVHELLYNKDNDPTSTTTIQQQPPQQPSPLELQLAQIVARGMSLRLPHAHLPCATSIFLVLVPMVVCLGWTVLGPQWYTPLRVWLHYRTVHHQTIQTPSSSSDTNMAVLLNVPAVVQTSAQEKQTICPLQIQQSVQPNNDNYYYYFVFQQCRYYWDPSTQLVYEGGPRFHLQSTQTLLEQSTVGLSNPQDWELARQLYNNDDNDASRDLLLPPTLARAFVDRLVSSPLTVLQLTGLVLELVEYGIVSSLTSLGNVLYNHYTSVRQSLGSARELAQEVQDQIIHTTQQLPITIHHYHHHHYHYDRSKPQSSSSTSSTTSNTISQKATAQDLLPGHVFGLPVTHRNGTTRTAVVVPVDALLLDGTCVANEAVLTGESVPQTKFPLDPQQQQQQQQRQGDNNDNNNKEDVPFDMMGIHRSSVLFAGTTIVTASQATLECMALRTGPYSSRGDLTRALQHRRGGGGGSSSMSTVDPRLEKDSLRMVVALTFCAVCSCLSVLFAPSPDNNNDKNNHHHRNVISFRRVSKCIRILLASIPTNTPFLYTDIAQRCATHLRQDAQVACSDAGNAVFVAARTDIVVLDKTGTLTADTQSLARIVTPNNNNNDTHAPHVVLAGCHSLLPKSNYSSDEDFLGDPLDKACLGYSRWKYNPKDQSFSMPKSERKKLPDQPGTAVVKLWQIKSFPFDPHRRTSSAVVLVRDQQGKYRVQKVMKGSPEVLVNHVRPSMRSWYQRQLTRLGKEGLRVVSLLEDDIDKTTQNMLFPCELCANQQKRNRVGSSLKKARKLAKRHLSRDEIEAPRDGSFGRFVGFGCFDATVRPSSRRIVTELKRRVDVTMLTGDGMDAALAVAKKAGLLGSDEKPVALLRYDPNKEGFRWRWKQKGTDMPPLRTHDLLEAEAMGECVLVTTGDVVEQLMTEHSSAPALRNAMFQFSVVARASPQQKATFISILKEQCKKHVLMCGDGVNDVAAMKLADCGVALLNGFGDESKVEEQSVRDEEDERRKQKLKERRIGRNRKLQSRAMVGVGESRLASQARMKARVDAAVAEIKQQAADRQGLSNANDAVLSFREMKAMLHATMQIGAEERKRMSMLKKGGGEAARLLAQDDVFGHGSNANAQSSTVPDIKAGEASLVASFSCLRPAIDGVDALLRHSVAAWASAIASQRGYALDCVMTSYTLATLYKDGFPYGKYMYNAEFAMSLMRAAATSQARSTPRPRLPSVAAPQPLLHPMSILGTCAQAFVHLASLLCATRIGRRLEAEGMVKERRLIQWVPASGDPSRRFLIDTVAEALVEAPKAPDKETMGGTLRRLLLGEPFKPNYPTNAVFFLSIFQGAVSSLFNFSGYPFSSRMLENRQLCLLIMAGLLLPVLLLLEVLPPVNALLELRPLPSRREKAKLLLVLVLDLAASWIVSQLSGRWEVHEDPIDDEITSSSGTRSAAREEEILLSEETALNRRVVQLGMVLSVVVVLAGLINAT